MRRIGQNDSPKGNLQGTPTVDPSEVAKAEAGANTKYLVRIPRAEVHSGNQRSGGKANDRGDQGQARAFERRITAKRIGTVVNMKINVSEAGCFFIFASIANHPACRFSQGLKCSAES